MILGLCQIHHHILKKRGAREDDETIDLGATSGPGLGMFTRFLRTQLATELTAEQGPDAAFRRLKNVARQLQAPLADALEEYVQTLAGTETFGSQEDNERFARNLSSALVLLERRLKCEKCGEPALPIWSAGCFQYRHSSGTRTTHSPKPPAGRARRGPEDVRLPRFEFLDPPDESGSKP